MSRGHNLHPHTYLDITASIDLCSDRFHVNFECFRPHLTNDWKAPHLLENVCLLESHGKLLFDLIGRHHDPPFETASVASIMQ